MPLARRQFREAGVEVAGLHPQLVSCSRRLLSTDAVFRRPSRRVRVTRNQFRTARKITRRLPGHSQGSRGLDTAAWVTRPARPPMCATGRVV